MFNFFKVSVLIKLSQTWQQFPLGFHNHNCKLKERFRECTNCHEFDYKICLEFVSLIEHLTKNMQKLPIMITNLGYFLQAWLQPLLLAFNEFDCEHDHEETYLECSNWFIFDVRPDWCFVFHLDLISCIFKLVGSFRINLISRFEGEVFLHWWDYIESYLKLGFGVFQIHYALMVSSWTQLNS